jgi:hypothetical protein
MQRPQDQMPCLGQGDGQLNRFQVTHLANQDDVRRLPEHATQGLRKRMGIAADLALVDDTLPVRVHVLNRILDRNHVYGTRTIDMVDHRGQCRGLAAAGRTCQKHQAMWPGGKLLGYGGHTQRFECGNLKRDDPQRQRYGAPLVVYIDAKTGNALNITGGITGTRLFKLFHLRVCQDTPGHGQRVLRFQDRRADAFQQTVDSELRLRTACKQQIRGIALVHPRNEFANCWYTQVNPHWFRCCYPQHTGDPERRATFRPHPTSEDPECQHVSFILTA